MKSITLNIDEKFLERVIRMVHFMKITHNLDVEINEFFRFGVCMLIGIEKGWKEIIINEEGFVGELKGEAT